MCERTEVSGTFFWFLSSGTVVASGPERSVIDGAIIRPVSLSVIFFPLSRDFYALAFLLYNYKKN